MVRHCGHWGLKAHFGLLIISLLELEFVLSIALIWVLILVVQERMMRATTFSTAFCLALRVEMPLLQTSSASPGIQDGLSAGS